MDAFEKIEQILYEDGVTVSRDKLPKCVGYFTSLYDFIYLNVDRDLRGADALSVLAHEEGHYRTGLSPYAGKNEYRADRWAADRLLPPSRIMDALRGGCRNTSELAFELNVGERYLRRCLTILSEKYGGQFESGGFILTFFPLCVLDADTRQFWPESSA